MVYIGGPFFLVFLCRIKNIDGEIKVRKNGEIV